MIASLPIPPKNILKRELALELALEGLTRLNCVLIEKLGLPSIYSGRVRYQRDKPGRESWDNIYLVMKRGWGDCEDLACARAAEYRVHEGIPAYTVVTRTGPRTLHARVMLPGGVIEDPSRRLGMGSHHR